jgi:hypothetical protein
VGRIKGEGYDMEGWKERDMAWERCREGDMARVRCTSWRERDMA